MAEDSLHLNTSTTASHHLQCKVHPVVIFSILDHFIRRNNENESRVVGTLLGSYIDGIVEVKNCFPVPHKEGEEVNQKKLLTICIIRFSRIPSTFRNLLFGASFRVC